MMPFPPPKKKKPDMALLLAEEPEKDPTDAMEGEDPEEDLDALMPEEEEPMAAEGEAPFADEAMSDIDPEQAALAETLGFTEPDQQQALIDLIKLVTSAADPMATESSSTLPPLPESNY